MSDDKLRIFDNQQALAENLAQLIRQTIIDLLRVKDNVNLGLSGGSLVDILSKYLPGLEIPWSKVKFFFVDERFVPFDSDESTFGLYREKLFRPLNIDLNNVLSIDANLSSIELVAQDYRSKLNTLLADDQSLDIILLGMGPDGHTASLFPNHRALDDDQPLLTFIDDSPKPPPCRVTLTMNSINRTKHKIIVASGSSKSSIIKQVLVDKSTVYPIGRVENGIWFIDRDAARELH